MSLFAAGLPKVGSSLPVALFVAALLVWCGVRIAKRVARGDSYPALAKVMIASVILHLLCAPAQIFVVDHFYGGVADWLRYDHQGALLAANWRSGHFTLAGSGVHRILGDGAVSIAGGIIMTIVGQNQLAAFFVSAWLAFVGSVFFYRAFVVTFPEANRRRYAQLLFFFPSLLFWTANVGKESIMLFALGLAAYGMALILVHRPLGYLYAVLGGALGLFVRPDELVILVIGFAVAMLFRARNHQGTSHPIRTVGGFVFVAAAVVITTMETAHFVHSLTGASGLSNTLTKVAANNQGVGAGFRSSSVSYSANPLLFPRDVYTVLFDPLPFSAHSVTQAIAAVENTVILAVILLSLPQLRCVLRACRERAYVFVALFYSAVFMYAFAALGNLGLITRERTLLLPILFVLLAIPIAPDGQVPYPWQRRRRQNRRLREGVGLATRGQSGDSASDLVEGVVLEGVAAQWVSESADGERMDWAPAEWVAE